MISDMIRPFQEVHWYDRVCKEWMEICTSEWIKQGTLGYVVEVTSSPYCYTGRHIKKLTLNSEVV